MNARPETMRENDVVALLLRQHEEIRKLFTEVETSTGEARAEAFDRLRRYLAVHETAEEMIVHPDARRAGADSVVKARLEEERKAKQLLADLEQDGPDAPKFLSRLGELKRAVLEHAEKEEREEFPKIKDAHGQARLRAMGIAVKAAEALAPTHPHPGVETARANLVAGPYTAMRDRVKDVIEKALAKGAKSTRTGKRATTRSRPGGEPTKERLYEQARKLGIKGRSKMTKAQLRRALGKSEKKTGGKA